MALEYIAQHRQQLEPELQEILREKAERERYYRAKEVELRKQRPVPMTPERVAFYALLEKSRQAMKDHAPTARHGG